MQVGCTFFFPIIRRPKKIRVDDVKIVSCAIVYIDGWWQIVLTINLQGPQEDRTLVWC